MKRTLLILMVLLIAMFALSSCDMLGQIQNSEIVDKIQNSEIANKIIGLLPIGPKECVHDYAAEVTDPTCTAKGYTTYTCKLCQDSYTADETEKTAHDYKDGVCSCGATDPNYVPPCKHSWVAPTCVDDGYCYRCKAEGEKATGHDFTEATCSQPAFCKVCGTQGEEKEHTFVDNVCTVCGACDHLYEQNTWYHPELVAATCTTPGVAVYECAYCDDYYTEEAPIDPEAHAFWGEEEIVTEANCATETNGLKKVACDNGCGAIEEVEIFYSESHNWDVQKEVYATCTEDGEYYAVCTICEEVESYTYYAEGHYNWYLTCGDSGECMACGETFTVEHNTVWSPATCTEAAYCMNCWSYVGEPLGHDYVDGVCSVCGDEKLPEATNVAINISDLASGKTVAGAELVEGTGIYTTSALDIDSNKKSIDGFDFTLRLKLGGTMKVDGEEASKAVKIVANGASKIIVYGMASSGSASGRTLLLATVEDGALVAVAETGEVGGASIAKYEISIPAAGTYYLGSTDSGINLYYIAVVYGSEEPAHECESICAECGKCTDATCEDAACSEKCQGHYVFETGEYLNYAGNDCYTFDRESYLESINVTYANVSTNTYQNINAWIKDKAEGHATLKLYIVNNGAETVNITVKLEAAGTGLGETKATVEAGQISEVVLDFVGAPELLYFFIDSGWSEANTTHAGDITIRGVRFVGEAGSGDVIIPEIGEYLNYQGNDCYTFDNVSYLESINVTYTSVNTNTWQNINTWVQDKAAGKSVLKLYIKNNGEETVKVTVKLEVSGAGVGETKVQVEAGQMIEVELEYAGAADLIFFFIDSDWSEETTTHAGDITISGVRFE